MALRKVESFDHVSAASLGQKWTSNSGSLSISTGGGRNGTNGLTGDNRWLQHGFDNQATWIVGRSLYIPPGLVVRSGRPLIAFYDGASLQFDVAFDGSAENKLVVRRNGTTLATAASGLGTGTYYIELKSTINNSGSYDVHVNGASVLSATGVDTQATGNAYANAVRISNPESTNVTDDVYICDGSGSAPDNDFLGDVRVLCDMPTGDGASSDWTASAGSDYQCVDEASPNDDTDYISSSTAGNISLFTFPNISTTSGTVYGIQTVIRARKDDAGTRTIKPVIRHSGNTEKTAVNVGDTYLHYTEIQPTDPDGGALTIADVNAIQLGVKLEA